MSVIGSESLPSCRKCQREVRGSNKLFFLFVAMHVMRREYIILLIVPTTSVHYTSHYRSEIHPGRRTGQLEDHRCRD